MKLNSLVLAVIVGCSVVLSTRSDACTAVPIYTLSTKDWSTCKTGSVVSFWDLAEFRANNRIIEGGYGQFNGLEFPIAFAISEENMKAFSKAMHNSPTFGGESGEKVVDRGFPISMVTSIFVPRFAVADTTRILKNHHLDQIRVLALPVQ